MSTHQSPRVLKYFLWSNWLVFGQEWGWDNAYAQDCLKRAREMLSFATNHVGKYSDSITNAKDFYTSWSGYNDEIVLSGAWIAKESSMMDTANHASDVANAKGRVYMTNHSLGGFLRLER